MTKAAAAGHNRPPDPLDEALAPFGDAIAEAETWLDGEAVENEGAMKAVDALLREIKEAHKAVSHAEESEAKPLYDEWKRTKERWKPTLDDLDRIKKGLIGLVDGFKRKLAAEKAEAERKARTEAEAARREAELAAMAASATDIEAQRAAAEAQRAAEEANARAAAASNDKVKGLRKVTRYEVTDHRALLHWIAANRRDDVTAFIDEWARKNHAAYLGEVPGMRVWQEKVAF